MRFLVVVDLLVVNGRIGILRKLILQMRMRSHPVGLEVWFLVGPFFYLHAACVWTAKTLTRLRGCAGSSEPLLVAYVTSTIISWAGSNKVLKYTRQKFLSVTWNFQYFSKTNQYLENPNFPEKGILYKRWFIKFSFWSIKLLSFHRDKNMGTLICKITPYHTILKI